MRHRRPARAAASVCAALVLAGCSVGADGAEPEEALAGEAAPEAAPAPTAVDGDLPETPPFERVAGPLEEILATVQPNLMPPDLPSAERDARFLRQVRQAGAYIAACMHEQGFEYLVNPDPVITWQRAVREDLEPGTREFVLEFAFSISNPAWYDETTGSDADPNAELLAAMSDAHREEWTRALHGDAFEAGCFQAGSQSFVGGQLLPDDEFAGLSSEANALLSRLWNTHDAGGNPIEEEWSVCMVDRGHPSFHSPTALRHSLENEFDAGVTDVEQFAAREFALAADSFRCEVQVDLRRRSQEWRHEQEAQFVEQHRAELDAWLLHVGAEDATD